MDLISIIILAVGLSMDAFAVSICKGLALKKIRVKEMAIVGLWFGGFQALMPTIGYFLGTTFAKYINKFSHWIAFALLLLIGGNMIREAFSKEEEEQTNSLGFKTMLLMAIATSIDALAVGVTFALDKTNVPVAVSIIGVTTFLLSAVAVKLGSLFGAKYKNKAEFVGGLILILLGVKILLSGLGVF